MGTLVIASRGRFITVNADWLDALKPGDLVAINVGNNKTHFTLDEVRELTKTRIKLVGSPYAFQRASGISIKAGYLKYVIEPVTDAVLAHVLERITTRLAAIDWQHITPQKLVRINNLLDGD